MKEFLELLKVAVVALAVASILFGFSPNTRLEMENSRLRDENISLSAEVDARKDAWFRQGVWSFRVHQLHHTLPQE